MEIVFESGSLWVFFVLTMLLLLFFQRDLHFGVSEAKRFMAQMKDYKQDKALTIYIPLFQCILNMTGKASNALLLKGEVNIYDTRRQ